MKTREQYKFFIDPKVNSDDTQSAVMLDFVLNSPYTYKTGYVNKGGEAVVAAEPVITAFDDTNGDVCTVAPGIYEDSTRPGGDRSTSHVGCKFTTGMVTGAKFVTQFTPTQAANIKTQPGYCGHIRSSSNDDGGLTQSNASFATLSKLPFCQWRRVRGPIVNTLDTLPGSIGASDQLSRSVRLVTNHSCAKWNGVKDIADCRDRFSWQLNDKTKSPIELDHVTWFLIPELTKDTLGVALQPPSGILTVTIEKFIVFTEPLSGKGNLDTANLPTVYDGYNMWRRARSYWGPTAAAAATFLAGAPARRARYQGRQRLAILENRR